MVSQARRSPASRVEGAEGTVFVGARALAGRVSEIDLNPVLGGRRGEGALNTLIRL
jgi:hypothetical protein